MYLGRNILAVRLAAVLDMLVLGGRCSGGFRLSCGGFLCCLGGLVVSRSYPGGLLVVSWCPGGRGMVDMVVVLLFHCLGDLRWHDSDV